jgi:hypothetical protein
MAPSACRKERLVPTFWGTSRPNRRRRPALAVAVVAAVALGGLAGGPASAAAPSTGAASKAGPQQPPKARDDTWLGRVQREGKAYAYVGRACPEQAEICYDIVAHYRIVPLNPAAARAVRRLAGGQARLHGHLAPGPQRSGGGALYVTRAERPRADTARTARAGDDDNGRTVKLAPGDHLEVVLHSTYWTFDGSSDPAVVSGDGDPVYAGGGPKCGGPPGSGCGTVTARFTAGAAGTAVVSAHRTSCGEALRCSPDKSRWALTVKVGS